MVLASDDDSGSGQTRRSLITPTTTGTYYLAAQALSGTGTYTVRASSVTDDFTGNSGTVGRLSVDGSVSGNIDFTGDVDWFATTLTAGSTYLIPLQGTSGQTTTLDDGRVSVYDANPR